MRIPTLKTIGKAVGALALSATLGLSSLSAEEEVKVGVLHSLSGTMAISETSLRDVVLMAAEEINAKGGVLGKKISPVVVDPASDWPLFAEKAKELIVDHEVAAIFGCWTSVSRKNVLPVIEERNALLFYPCNTKAKNSPSTCSTPLPPLTSSSFLLLLTPKTNSKPRSSTSSAPTTCFHVPQTKC